LLKRTRKIRGFDRFSFAFHEFPDEFFIEKGRNNQMHADPRGTIIASAAPVPSTNHWPQAMANDTTQSAKTRMVKKETSIPRRSETATLKPVTRTHSEFANQQTALGWAMRFQIEPTSKMKRRERAIVFLRFMMQS